MKIETQPEANFHQPMRSQAIHHVSFGEGEPLILIHGAAASHHDWTWLAPKLVAHGYRLAALDLPGHGESVKPEDPQEYNAERMSARLSEWLNGLRLEEPLVLVGHSMGGYLSLLHALHHPSQVRALVLISPLYSPAQLSSFLRLVHRRPELSAAALRLAPEWLVHTVLELDASKAGRLPPAARRQTATNYKRASSNVVYFSHTLQDLTPLLPQISQPTLVIWGEKDPTLKPESFPHLVEALPNASGRSLPDCGHQPHIGKPEQVARLTLDFLAKLKQKEETSDRLSHYPGWKA